MEIKILGSGCASCDKLEQVTREAVANCKIEAEIEKVTEMEQIIAFGVMSTPALVIDGEVKLSGRVPSARDIERILEGTGSCGCSCGGCC